MTFKTEYTCLCPHTHKQTTIQLNYIADMQGRFPIGYKKDSWHCPMKPEFPFVEQDRYQRCPVYYSAPNSPF